MKNYEALFNGQCKPQYPRCGCDSVKGNSTEVSLAKGDCEVRADVIVARTSGVRIWGRVKDCEGRPVGYALVKLVRLVNNFGNIDVEGVAHTMTDCNGFYQFEVSPCEVGAKYRVLVHKAASGCERKIPDSEMQCDPCSPTPPCPPTPPCDPNCGFKAKE
ncbi:hypothetical protein DVW12_17145 [Clostridium botulinum]|nr:hypothetical protein [Clostridium botulinum]